MWKFTSIMHFMYNNLYMGIAIFMRNFFHPPASRLIFMWSTAKISHCTMQRTRANIKEQQHRRILYIFFLPADASRTFKITTEHSTVCIWSDLFITPTGNTVLHLVQALQYYKFSAVQPGNLRRIIAGHKKIWPFNKGDRAMEKGRGWIGGGRGREGAANNRRSYVWM